MSIVPYEPAELDLTTASLDELAAEARSQYDTFEAGLGVALAAFIRLGEILTAARARVPSGDWQRWCKEVGISAEGVAAQSMRLAHYRHHLPPEAWHPFVDAKGHLRNASHSNALKYVRGLPPIRPLGVVGADEETKAEALRLRDAGLTNKDIGSLLGVTGTTVAGWIDPAKYRENQRRNAERRRALSRERDRARRVLAQQREREERDRLAKTTGGELENAYSLIRRALAAVSKAGNAELAEQALLKAEEELIAAMRSHA